MYFKSVLYIIIHILYVHMVQGEDGECVRVLVEEGRGGRLVNEIILAEEKTPLRYTVYPWQHVTMATSTTLMYIHT